MTTPNKPEGLDMNDEQIYELALKHCYATTAANGFIFDRRRGDMLAFARALLSASKPAAPDQGYVTALIKRMQDYCDSLAPPIARGLMAEAVRALLAASPAAPAQSGELIYQMQFTGNNWEDVTKETFDQWSENVKSEHRRIVYTTPQSSQPVEAGEPTDDMPPPLKGNQRMHAVALYMSLPHNMDSAEIIATKVATDAYVNGFQAGKQCASPQPSPTAVVLDDERAAFEKIGAKIHYPACWDTAAYPTLASALVECADWYDMRCGECLDGSIARAASPQSNAAQTLTKEQHDAVELAQPVCGGDRG